MKKLLTIMVVTAFLLVCLAGQALAVGVGMYFEGARGDGDFEYDYSAPEFDVDVDSGAFGFVMDTDLSDRSGFNYRLNVGLERLDMEDDSGDTLELGGLVVSNTFGFAIIKNPDFRWWIGPQIRVGFYGGETESDPATDYGLFAFGLGGVTGVNFVTGNACISTSLGLMSTGFAGETDGPGTDEDFDGDYSTVFLNIAVLFGR